jgi:hypothetical protein
VLKQLIARFAQTEQVHPSPAADLPLAEPIPASPPGEPSLTVGPQGAWSLYRGEPDPLDLHRLAILPHRFDSSSGGYGAYWLTRAILMLSERPTPVSLPYVRGLLDRMQRSGDWSTAQLEAPPDEGDETAERAPRPVARHRHVAMPQGEQRPAPPAPSVEGRPIIATFYRYAHRRAPGLRLVREQEQRLEDRVRDQELWETVCANWDAEGHKFSVSDNLLDRYCTMEARAGATRREPSDGLSKLEREIHELPVLSEGEKASHCATMMSFPLEDRRRYISDLRQRLGTGQGA